MKNALLWLELSLQDQRMAVPMREGEAHFTFPQEKKGKQTCVRSRRGRCSASCQHLGE